MSLGSYNVFARWPNALLMCDRQEYSGSVVPFGGWVMLKKEHKTHHRSKLRSEWIKGAWLGKFEVSDACGMHHKYALRCGSRKGQISALVQDWIHLRS